MQDINTRLYLDVINNLYSKKVLKVFLWLTDSLKPFFQQQCKRLRSIMILRKKNAEVKV